MSTSKQYIELFNQLSDPIKSHSANQKILNYIVKQESWKIAKQLMSNQQYHLHGCQLLSRKLNFPYTPAHQQKYKITQFILSFHKLNSTLYLCLGKLALHLNWPTLEFNPPHNNYLSTLNTLKSLSQVSDIITLQTRKDPRQNVKILYEKYKQFLIQVFPAQPLIVVQCFQNYTNNGFKIQSQQLVRLILTRPLAQVSQMLQNILLGQTYPGLNNQIFSYLLNQSKDNQPGQYFNVFLAFLRSVNILQLNADILKQILQHILNICRIELSKSAEELKNATYISDSFDFWQQLSQKINKNIIGIRNSLTNNNGNITVAVTLTPQHLPQQVNISLQAFTQLWKIILQRSMQYSVPKLKQQKQDNLHIINLDDDDQDNDQIIDLQQSDPNTYQNTYKQSHISTYAANSFRNTGQDFLNMIYSLVSKIPGYRIKCLQMIHQLTTSSSYLQLELSTFVLSSIVQNADQNSSQQICALIFSISNNSNFNDAYLWQKFIKLLGKLGHQTICNIQVLKSALHILKQSIKIPQIAILACQNFNQILTTCSTTAQKQQKIPYLQQYFSYVYTQIYFTTNNEKVFQKLTKSIFLYLYYFKQSEQDVINYLKEMSSKIAGMDSCERQCQILQNIAICHNFVDEQKAKRYTYIISQFFTSFLQNIIKYVSTLKQHKKLSLIFLKLNMMITVGGGYNTDKWIQAILILQSLPNLAQEISNIIYLCNKLMDVPTHNAQYRQSIHSLIVKFQPYITASLLAASSDDHKLINKCLTFHLMILNKYIDVVQSYNPDSVLGFIVEKIYKGYLSYQFQSTRTSLAIVRNVISRGYRVDMLLEQTLRVYPKIVDNLWKSLEGILLDGYRMGGADAYKAIFMKIYPELAPPNPLFDAFIEALKKSNSKDFKNLLINLR